jgi:hypothetical protein
MIRHAALLAALLVTAISAFAQDITIKPVLREGDAFRLEVIRIRENSSRPQQNGKTRTPVDIRVASARPDGFVLDWINGATVRDNAQGAADPLTAATSKAVQNLRFRILLNADGDFKGLENQAEIEPRLQAILDLIMKEASAAFPAENRKAFVAMIGQVLSPAALITAATGAAQIYFGLNGLSIGVGKAAELPIESPAPVGEGVIPATFRVQMDSATAESASLKTTTTFDSAALRRMTQSFVQQAGAPVSPEQLAKIPPMQMNDDARYSYDRKTGLMREVVVNRRISSGSVVRYDGWEIRLISAPSR